MLDAKVKYSATGSTSSLIFDSDMLLEKVQNASINMLRTATAAMGVRKPEVAPCSVDMAGACVAYSGADVPLTCAIGVGTSSPVDSEGIAAIEAFYDYRKSPVRIAISGRTRDSESLVSRPRIHCRSANGELVEATRRYAGQSNPG